MATKITNGLDLLKTNLVQAVLHPMNGNNPTSPAEGQVWYRSDEGRFYIHTNGGSKAMAFSDDGASGVLETAFDANTILAANLDNTPAALTIPEQALVGRVTGGNIDALTASEVRTLLGIEANAAADQNASEVPFNDAGFTATDVSAALIELNTDKAETSHTQTLSTITDAGTLAGKSEAALTDIVPISGNTILGRSGAGTGNVAELDAATVRALLNLSTADLSDGSDLATNADVSAAIAGLVGSAPAILDTIQEIAAAIGAFDENGDSLVTLISERTKKFNTTIGDGASTSIAVTHGLNTKEVVVSVRETTGDNMVIADWVVTNSTTVTFNFPASNPPTLDQYTVVIVG